MTTTRSLNASASLMNLVLILFAFLATSCRSDGKDKVPPKPPKDRLACTWPWFERIGDLKGCDTTSDANDISGDGRKVVGNSSANEDRIDDCQPGAHRFEAYGWTRPCERRPFLRTPAAILFRPTGIIPLGYGDATTPESMARGIDPGGDVVVGWSTLPGTANEAMQFDMHGSKIRLGRLTGHQISMASDVSERFTGAVERIPPGSILAGRDASRAQFERIIVGYSSAGDNHAQRTPGAVAVYWGPYAGMMTQLDPPDDLPPIRSSEAVAVSDQGIVIGGNQYYGELDADANTRYKCIPCSWRWDDVAHAYDAQALEDLAGGERDARLAHVSGDGRVLVGMGTSGVGQRACVWEAQVSGTVLTWSAPTALEPLPGMSYSLALGTDYFGGTIVGVSGIPFTEDDVTQHATLWERIRNADGSWGPWGPPVDIFETFRSNGLATDVPRSHWTVAKRISEFGHVITGSIDDNADGFVEGWVGALP